MKTPSSRSRVTFKANTRRVENAKIYANPLPVIFSDPPKPSRSVFNLLGLSPRAVINPHCEGIFDPTTKSVWVLDPRDAKLLWQRGFFGKGTLSRSEPSWLTRQLNLRQLAGKHVTSEEITAKRRAQRKQFKLDRAAAIAAVAAEAEEIFATEGRVVVPALSGPAIPSASTWRPSPTEQKLDIPSPAAELSTETQHLEDVEHLQLTLTEAFFLAWIFDCLTIQDAFTGEQMSLQEIWMSFQTPALLTTPTKPCPHFENSFLIHYVIYHHYRSLGWVVKGGMKFCVNYLLYKRGPVFTHAEFALVVCPVYEDPEEAQSATGMQNRSPFSWSWLSTINRVNSQAQKV